MDGLSFSDTPIDSWRGGGGGGEFIWNLYGVRTFFQKFKNFQKFLINLWKERMVWEWEYFFRKFHCPSESQLVCPIHSRVKE